MFAVQPRWRKTLVAIVVALLFVGLYEVTTHDAKRTDPDGKPTPGAQLTLSATAYCKGTTTAAGVAVQAGSAASDPSLLPLGSIVQVETGDPRYDGMYTVLDTGPQIKGRELDIYLWSCYEALEFGRKQIKVTVLRKGWHPQAIPQRDPSLWDRLIRRPKPEPNKKEAMKEPPRETPKEPLPSQPLPQIP